MNRRTDKNECNAWARANKQHNNWDRNGKNNNKITTIRTMVTTTTTATKRGQKDNKKAAKNKMITKRKCTQNAVANIKMRLLMLLSASYGTHIWCMQSSMHVYEAGWVSGCGWEWGGRRGVIVLILVNRYFLPFSYTSRDFFLHKALAKIEYLEWKWNSEAVWRDRMWVGGCW